MLRTRSWVTNQREITEFPAKSIFQKQLFHCLRPAFDAPTLSSTSYPRESNRVVLSSNNLEPGTRDASFPNFRTRGKRGTLRGSSSRRGGWKRPVRKGGKTHSENEKSGGRRKKKKETRRERERERKKGEIRYYIFAAYYVVRSGTGFIPTAGRCGHYREILQMHLRTPGCFWTLA